MTAPPNPRSDFFTHNWTLTIPSRPDLKYYRANPALHSEILLPIASNENNNQFQDTKGKTWDEAAIQAWKQNFQTRYEDANRDFKALEILIELDGKVVGYGGIWVTGETEGSIGVVLNEDARGKGVGKVTVRALAQLCLRFGLKATCGTMKANMPMRSTMKSLGVPEMEKVVELPGRGVVAELEYTIERQNFGDELDYVVTFRENQAQI